MDVDVINERSDRLNSRTVFYRFRNAFPSSTRKLRVRYALRTRIGLPARNSVTSSKIFVVEELKLLLGDVTEMRG